MIRLKSKDTAFPEKYPVVERKLPTVSEPGYTRVDGFELRDKVDFMPQPGMQEFMHTVDADIMFFGGNPGGGKGLPLDFPVCTPNGFVKNGDLEVGDIISGSDGKPQTVLGVYDQGLKDVYRLKFIDGTYVDCDDDHLWKVMEYASKEYQILPFSIIRTQLDDKKKLSIPLCKPIEFSNKIDRGSIQKYLHRGIIPHEYIFSSIEDRMYIIDTLVNVDNTSYRDRLANQIKLIADSLGFKSTITDGAWFGMKSISIDKKSTHREIVGYEYIGKKETRCIKVSNPDSLYIAGEGFAVTHNTFGELLFALTGINRPGYSALIIKKELTSTKDVAGGIIKDAHLIYDNFGKSEFSSSDSPSFNFRQWGTTISFTHSNFDANTQSSEMKSQERAKNFQCSVIVFDELTGFDYKIWKYWMARNRDSSGIRPKMICTFNTNSHHFSRVMIDYYIGEDGKVREDRIGKVRYAWFKGDTVRDIIWGDTREEIIEKHNVTVPDDLAAIGIKPADMIKSFVFLPCKMSENRILMNATAGGHAANIFNMGGTETQKLFYEDWNAEDEGNTTISRQMVRNMFSNPLDQSEEMFASLDVSGGGDENPMFIWKGDTIISIEVIKKEKDMDSKEWYKQLVPWIDQNLSNYSVPVQNFSFDATGIGNYLHGYTNGRPVTPNLRQIQEVDSFGNPVTTEQYYTLRSQLLGKLQFMFETGQISCILSPQLVLPHGKRNREFLDILYEEMDVFKRIVRSGKFYYKSKDEFKARYHYSPNYIDAISYKMIFNIEGRARKEKEIEFSESDYYQAFN